MENENNVEEQQTPAPDTGGLQRGKKRWIGILVLLGSMLVIYLGFSFFFMSHYYFGTTISGVDCGGRNKKQVTEQILNPTVDLTVTLAARDNVKVSVMTEGLDINYTFDDTLYQINASQNGFNWIGALFYNKDYDLPVYITYDEEQLTRELKQLPIFDQKICEVPRDAYIGEYQTDTGAYSIVSETLGNTLNFDKTLRSIEDAFTRMVLSQKELVIDLEQTECYEKPLIYSDDSKLVQALQTANTYVSTKITYDWNGQQEVIDGDIIKDWIMVDQTTVNLDEDGIYEYLKSLSKKNDTYGKNRMFTTTQGNEIELRSGAYGWKTDVQTETEELVPKIKTGVTEAREPVYRCQGYVKGADDIGDSYVEINLSAQHLYLYEDGAVVFESDFVSGNMSNGCATPAGVFGITYRTKNAVLRGDNYETPVHYWMPFNGNIGMHDATWRGAFGGDIYLTRGSHGCINLPLASAERIYGYMKTGFPVICYY